MNSQPPNKPQRISTYAVAVIEALSKKGLGSVISLGGAFGLSHYYEFRETHDIDAWWEESAGLRDQEAVVTVVKEILSGFGSVKERRWGDVVSVELVIGGKKVFSFQIAERSARLKESLPSPWQGILLDAFEDIVASKMAALVNRGAPRDFTDIYHINVKGAISVSECWSLWEKRQRLASIEADISQAKLAVRTHLERLELYRPIDTIKDDDERNHAAEVRRWFKEVFCHE